MINVKQVNALGEIVNSSWGRSSDGTYDCKVLIEGNRLRVMYSTMAYFASESAMSAQTRRLAEESNDRISELVSSMKDKKKGIWRPTKDSDLKVFSPLLLTGLPGLKHTLGHPTRLRGARFFRKRAVNVKKPPLMTFLGVPDDRTSMD